MRDPPTPVRKHKFSMEPHYLIGRAELSKVKNSVNINVFFIKGIQEYDILSLAIFVILSDTINSIVIFKFWRAV